MKLTKKNPYVLPLTIYIGVNLIFFFISYFAIKPLSIFMEQYVILFANVLVSLFIARGLKITITKKLLFIVAGSILGLVIGFLLVLSTMALPGSREHNYVMYEVCMPAMKQHYGLKENEAFPDSGQYDKEGQQKWWYQHSECEQNLWDGKGPVFSENPPEFVPVEK